MKSIRILLAALLLAAAMAAHARAKPISLEEVLERSERVDRGKVLRIHHVPDETSGYRVAELKVDRTFKGSATNTVLFLASPSWTGDLSSAGKDERGLYLLTRRSRFTTTARFMTAWREQFGSAPLYFIAQGGRGRLLKTGGEGRSMYSGFSELTLPQELTRSRVVVENRSALPAEALLRFVEQRTGDSRFLDPERAAKAPVVLRVKSLGVGEGSKYLWHDVEVLKVLKNTSSGTFAGRMRIAHYSSARGIPDGASTVYLERYHPARGDLWKLLKGDGQHGVSHPAAPPER